MYGQLVQRASLYTNDTNQQPEQDKPDTSNTDSETIAKLAKNKHYK